MAILSPFVPESGYRIGYRVLGLRYGICNSDVVPAVCNYSWRFMDGLSMAYEQMSIGWLSKNTIDRHRPVFMAMQWGLFVIGAIFWIDSSIGSQGFNLVVFGSLAYSIPAKVWSFACMMSSALCILGLIKPVRRWMVAFGAGGHCVQFVLISYSAVFTGGAYVIGLYASILLLPLHMWLFFEAAIRDTGD